MRILFLFFVLAAIGCNSDNTDDIANQAAKEAKLFYEAFKTKQYESTLPFLDTSLTAAVGKEDWIGLCSMRDKQEMGAIKDYKETKREVKAENDKVLVVFEYEVNYEKKKFYEEITFIRRGSDYKITRYVFDAQPIAVARQNQKKAHDFVARFYHLLESKNYEAVVNSMLDAEALQANPAADWFKLFTTKDSLLGKLNRYEYHDTQHRPRGAGMAYLLHYANQYEKHQQVNEEFFLVQYGEDFKILSYFYQPK